MFQSSKDILNIVISFCIVWVTVFICWMFYYLMKIFKDTSKIIEEFRIRLQGLSEAIKNIGEKIERVQNVLNMVTGSVGSFMKRTGKKKNDRSSEDDDEAGSFAEVAKDAVDRAVEATADRMRKITKKIRK